MTSLATPYVTDGDLIIVVALVTGPAGSVRGRFVLDTGAAWTTMTPEVADSVGYSARDGIRRTRVHTAVGEEAGYTLRVADLAALGVTIPDFEVHVFDLGHLGLDGLLGMNFLGNLDMEIRTTQQLILVGGHDELARLREAHARTSRALDAALQQVARERARADALDARAALLLRKLEAARKSVSFRFGRATRVALDTVDPRRWLRTFRGEDEILDDLADDPPVDVPADTPLDPAIVLAGAPADPSPLAVLDGSSLPARKLTPHGWRAELELRPASLIIVTADALASGTPWGDWGTPGGHDGRALLGELVTWCRARVVAVAYWGAPPAPALPFDLIVPA